MFDFLRSCMRAAFLLFAGVSYAFFISYKFCLIFFSASALGAAVSSAVASASGFVVAVSYSNCSYQNIFLKPLILEAWQTAAHGGLFLIFSAASFTFPYIATGVSEC